MKWPTWALIVAVLAILAVSTCGCAALRNAWAGLQAAGEASLNSDVLTAPPEGEPDPFGATLTGVAVAVTPWIPWAGLLAGVLQIFRQRRRLSMAQMFQQVVVQVVQEIRKNPATLNRLEATVEAYCEDAGLKLDQYKEIVQAVKDQLGIKPVESQPTPAPASSPA